MRLNATLLVLLSAAVLAQTAPIAIPDGTIIEARMVRGIESKKARAGDVIEAETTWPVRVPSGAVLIPKGSHLFGHVTNASGPTLGLVFDSVGLPDGSRAALDATIQGADVKLDIAEFRAHVVDPVSAGGLHIVRVENCSGEPLQCDYIVRYPVERVSIEQAGRNEALLDTTAKNVKLPKGAKVVLLVGPLEDVCRAKGNVHVPELKPGFQFVTRPRPARPPAGTPTRLALVVDQHEVIGCTQSADAWVDVSYYKK